MQSVEFSTVALGQRGSIGSCGFRGVREVSGEKDILDLNVSARADRFQDWFHYSPPYTTPVSSSARLYAVTPITLRSDACRMRRTGRELRFNSVRRVRGAKKAKRGFGAGGGDWGLYDLEVHARRNRGTCGGVGRFLNSASLYCSGAARRAVSVQPGVRCRCTLLLRACRARLVQPSFSPQDAKRGTRARRFSPATAYFPRIRGTQIFFCRPPPLGTLDSWRLKPSLPAK